ncbi:thioesterase family protein [Reinekea sp. G2M2-21]|uniref:acyl-CoA thioesterase n=1 Tax=Reinekea sp. G2M2-21 TaxID=2788942 RepID=UPI0018A8C494|nr:thioesterase family protein [Reinekea sp. G2M2-21]
MTEAYDHFCKQYPVVIELPVQWGDMDALQHVNNIVYLRWFESARIAYFDRVALMDRLHDEKAGPILASSEVKYRVSVEYPDRVIIGVRVEELREQDLIQQYAVFSTAKNCLVTTGQSRVVMFDFSSQQKVDIPPDVAFKIKQLEKLIA